MPHATEHQPVGPSLGEGPDDGDDATSIEPSLQQAPPLPPVAPVPFGAAPSLIAELAPAPPERYGKYNLLERIGLGGMAEVWRAKTLGAEGFTKDLVIKRVLPQFSGDEELLRMFIDEARLAARLQHANIVQIFDFDREGDTYYLAMELVEGRDLRQIEKAAARVGAWFDIPMSVYLIAEALKGLHYAHTKTEHGQPLHLVHRDISPHNILISVAGDVKISDFGIAKVAQRVSRTMSGVVRGKLAYMSPEQITGQPLDGRTDIYSMGVVLWELLSKNRLFVGADEREVVRRVRDGLVPPPRRFNPDIPEDLERIVLKMLLADRSRRYQTASEVARDLCALPCYAYEAQALGDLIRRLFTEKPRNWTQMLQSMAPPQEAPSAAVIDSQAPASAEAAPSVTHSPPPPSEAAPVRSNMAGSDQKTVMATEIPPEVAARLAEQKGRPSGAVAPVAPATPAPATAARTIIAEGPKVMSSGAAAARTVMATAQPGVGGAGPPPMAAPGQPPPPAQGYGPPAAFPPMGAPPMGADAPVRASSPNPQATVMMSPNPQGGAGSSHQGTPGSSNPQGARPAAPPLPLQPASAVLRAPVGGAVGPGPATLWVGGPALALALGLVTLLITNRIWPRATSGVITHPTVAGEVGQVQLITVPPGATVLVEGVEQKERTPMHVDGPPGKSAKVRVVAKGYEPYDVVVQYPKDSRPPLHIKLAALGKGTGHDQDPSLYHDRDGTKTTRDPDEDPKPQPKVAVADPQKDQDPEDQDPPAETPTVKNPGRRGHHVKGQAAAPDKGQAAAPDKGQAAAPDKGAQPAPDKGADKVADGPAVPHGKGLLSVTVRPWAIVYIDGHKLQQTPLRDYAITPGKHSLLLVNDTKGKRETVPLNITAGQPYSVSKSWE